MVICFDLGGVLVRICRDWNEGCAAAGIDPRTHQPRPGHDERARAWKALRMYWRARWIGVFWHALTAKHMAPGGTTAKRDRAAYEAD